MATLPRPASSSGVEDFLVGSDLPLTVAASTASAQAIAAIAQPLPSAPAAVGARTDERPHTRAASAALHGGDSPAVCAERGEDDEADHGKPERRHHRPVVHAVRLRVEWRQATALRRDHAGGVHEARERSDRPEPQEQRLRGGAATEDLAACRMHREQQTGGCE